MKRRVRALLIVGLLGTLTFSLFQLILIERDYRQGEAIYQDALDRYVTKESQRPGAVDAGGSLPDLSEEGKEDNSASTTALLQSAAEVEVDFAALKKVNSDIIGWIMIEQTVINYPLLQGSDNQKYLTTAYNGQSNRQGSIFMDCNHSPDFSNRHTIIYGHYMKNGSMFGALANYSGQSFYDSHRYFYILTEDGLARYEIVSAYTADVGGMTYQRAFPESGGYEAFLGYIMGQSQIESGAELTAADQIVTLSTCTPSSSRQLRFVVHGRLCVDGQTDLEDDEAPAFSQFPGKQLRSNRNIVKTPPAGCMTGPR